jgi:hypothetical protein
VEDNMTFVAVGLFLGIIGIAWVGLIDLLSADSDRNRPVRRHERRDAGARAA